ncbi:HAD superfamily, subfamily IIIB (Acid phosphatase) [uncultured archaeon]|nr:HAD superfamily, subfamily IIIB (Acid phosphatase) [uncultured archaeon]
MNSFGFKSFVDFTNPLTIKLFLSYLSKVNDTYTNVILFLLSKNQLPSNPAITLDIDETVLSSISMESGEGIWLCDYLEWDRKQIFFPALPKVKEFLTLCKTLGITIFFITGRPSSMLDFTVQNFDEVGFLPLVGNDIKERIYMFDGTERSHHIVRAFKEQKRKEISDKGYNILMNIGDQVSDTGKYNKYTVLLENPYYTI